MSKKNKIIVSIVGITIVLLALLGITYAYYLTRIEGNTNTNSISLTTADLKLVYRDGNGHVSKENIMPGTTIEKTFTVENTGNNKVDNYAVYLEEIVNTLTRTEDLTYVLTCESTSGTCDGGSSEFPKLAGMIATNSIETGVTHTYKLTVIYENLETVDQSADMGSVISGFVQIYAMADILDIEGLVENYTNGDYAQINSIQKRSQIVDGNYKFAGVLPGTHTIKVCGKEDTTCSNPKLSQQIEVKTGTTAGVSGNIITTTEKSQSATININVSSGSIEIDSTIKEMETSPFPKGTLAYAILNNAKTGTTGTKFVETPPSKIGESTSTTFEDGVEIVKTYDKDSWEQVYSEAVIFYISKSDYDSGIMDGVDVWNGCFYAEGYCPSEFKSYSWWGSGTATCEDLADSYIYIFSFYDESNYFNDKLGIPIYVSSCVDGIPSDGTTGIEKIEKHEIVLSKTTDDDGITYYYRGNVVDNYVTFANKCWRIMRINGDESIRLILEDNDEVCSSNMNRNATIESTSFNIVYSDTVIPTINTTSFSNYENTHLSSYKSYLSPGNYCIETFYSAFDINSPLSNTLKCVGNKLTHYNDGKDMYVGTLTLVEALHSGAFWDGEWSTEWTTSYLTSAVLSGTTFGMLSYTGFTGDEEMGYYSGVFNYSETGLWTTYLDINTPRPVINLKKDIGVSRGNGTIDNPYVIE